MIAASVTIQQAVKNLRRERQSRFRGWLSITLILAIAFVLVQIPSMIVLLHQQQALREKKLALYMLIFVLILLHGLHVLGGIVALAQTSFQARRNVYDHEHHQPVDHVALYWHFLDGVWLVMFSTFLLMK